MKYSLFVACIICVLLGGSEVTSLLSKTRRAPLSLLSPPTTTTTTEKPLQATNTLTSSFSKLLRLGAPATTTPTPQTKIKEVIPDLGSIQSELNEIRKSASLAAEKLAPSPTENPHVNVSDPNVPTPSSPTSIPNTSKQVSLEPSHADVGIPPASCTEVELNCVEAQRDENQSVESEQTAVKDTFKENDRDQFGTKDGSDSQAGKGDLNIEQTMKKPEDVEAVSIIPIVTDSASEIIESILNLADLPVLEGESKNPVEKHPLLLSDKNDLELSAPNIIDQIDDATPKDEEENQSLPSISEELPSELINKSTDPTIHPTDLELSASSSKAVEHTDLQKQDIQLISEEILPLPSSPKPEEIKSIDSLLPEVETVIPSTISTDPVNKPLTEAEGPDNESPTLASLENTEINLSVIPVTDVEPTHEKVSDAEHNNLPIQEDPSTNQLKSDELVRHSDYSNTIQCETDNVSELNTLLNSNNPTTKTDTQSTDSEDLPVELTNPVVETENINNLPAIPSETPVASLPEVTLPPTSAVKYVISTGLNKLSSSNFNTGSMGLQYRTDPVPVAGSPLATSLGTDNSVRGFYNLFNYGDEPLIDIHNNEFNLLKIVIF
ncbi:flocculation protein FLO11-like [Bradysia coprophila]|uniref:flocculation protein FLO11-like n=1 Tax=Bradysia coprophila TaxID=38358 RepID=UPI00187DB37D|nr:flocculation protein FLO11-like [Bradysia coprophila]